MAHGDVVKQGQDLLAEFMGPAVRFAGPRGYRWPVSGCGSDVDSGPDDAGDPVCGATQKEDVTIAHAGDERGGQLPHQCPVRGEDEEIVVRGYGADVRVVDHLSESALPKPVLLPIDPDAPLLVKQVEDLDVIIVGERAIRPRGGHELVTLVDVPLPDDGKPYGKLSENIEAVLREA